ncbi:MAG TPA: hypothetical protein VEJ39_08460 [Candidatus Acidoferrales bacterium]|nr:hypothetical protein [Candidatus Acidoferrales bacterium]
MAVRTCPYSLTKIPAATVVVHSYDLVCPGCGRALEISRVSRNLAVFIGLIAGVAGGYLGYYGALEHHHSIGFVLPISHAIIFYGVAAAVVLMLTADLSLKSEPDAHTHSSRDAGTGGHGAGHH